MSSSGRLSQEKLSIIGDKPVDNIVQYILVRTDLKWSKGAMVAQACHASIASIVSTMDHTSTKEYLKDLYNMHKIILKVETLGDLRDCEKKLKDAEIAHHLWVERPENIITCLAISPQPRSKVQSLFKHLKLLK